VHSFGSWLTRAGAANRLPQQSSSDPTAVCESSCRGDERRDAAAFQKGGIVRRPEARLLDLVNLVSSAIFGPPHDNLNHHGQSSV